MYGLVTLATKSSERRRYDDDTVDRLHNRYTVVILVVFTVVIVGQHYYGSPITCWMPAFFTKAWTTYTNNLCWINNTYYVPLHDDVYLPRAHEIARHQYIEYYQWLPFILLTQAFFFFLPSLCWQALNSKAGVDSDNILECSHSISKITDADKRARMLTLVANQIDRFVSNPRYHGERGVLQKAYHAACCICSLWSGCYLITLYIIVKVLYVANVLLQMAMISYVFKTNYKLYGLRWFLDDDEDQLDEQRFLENTVFPKVTMCDIYVRVLGNNQRHTVQCVLPVNMFTEKMYIFLWWWMVIVLICTLLDLAVWLIRSLLNPDRLHYVRGHLQSRGRLRERGGATVDKGVMRQFTYAYLKQDGVFLFRMIGHNTNQLTLEDIMASVWENWREKHSHRKKRPSSVFDLDDRTPFNGTSTPLKRQPSIPSAPPIKLDSVDYGLDSDRVIQL